jgi:hypothetical protein
LLELPLVRARRTLVAFLEREATLCCLVAAYILLLSLTLPQQLVQDSWLTLVGGREVVEAGLPRHDNLAAWTSGARWVDQQWLGQVLFYALFLVGGVKSALLLHAALLVAAVTAALAAARRQGASTKATGLVASVAILLAPWALQMRAQTLAQVLFVLLLWLLVADSRSASWRVLLVVPLLVAWANVHGTVVLGGALVVLRGLTSLASGLLGVEAEPRWRVRGTLLVLAPAMCVFASPYGLSLAGYYERLLFNPLLRDFVDEWGSSTPSAKTGVFFLVGFASVWLLARHGDRLTSFERLALLLTLASGVLAVRSIVWFALTALVVLPRALDGALSRDSRDVLVRWRLALGTAGIGLAIVFVAVALSRPSGWYESRWPASALGVVSRVTEADPTLRVLADDRYADWLLWKDPDLRGRVAYDVRFELFSKAQFETLYAYRNGMRDGWRRARDGYRLHAFHPTESGWGERSALADGKVLYGDDLIAVVLRPANGSGSG